MPPRLPPVKPYDPGPNAKVRPLEGPLHMGGQELALHDTWAREQVQATGTRLLYYSLNVDRSVVHALYDESIIRHYDGPYRLDGYVEWPKSNPLVREEGLQVKWSTRVWIPRASFEAARCPVPLEGDVVQAWRTPFFESWGVAGDEPQEGGYFFTVTVSNAEGHLYDEPEFVGFELQVTRSTDFTPERRMDNLRLPDAPRR